MEGVRVVLVGAVALTALPAASALAGRRKPGRRQLTETAAAEAGDSISLACQVPFGVDLSTPAGHGGELPCAHGSEVWVATTIESEDAGYEVEAVDGDDERGHSDDHGHSGGDDD